VPGVADDGVAVREGAGVGEPIDHTGVVGNGEGTGGKAAVIGGEHTYGSVDEPSQGGV